MTSAFGTDPVCKDSERQGLNARPQAGKGPSVLNVGLVAMDRRDSQTCAKMALVHSFSRKNMAEGRGLISNLLHAPGVYRPTVTLTFRETRFENSR
jgi:hypothetical protein